MTTAKCVSDLTDIELMKAFSTYCGIYNEYQFEHLLQSLKTNAPATLLLYDFALLIGGELVLTEAGIICSEVMHRFTEGSPYE